MTENVPSYEGCVVIGSNLEPDTEGLPMRLRPVLRTEGGLLKAPYENSEGQEVLLEIYEEVLQYCIKAKPAKPGY